MTNFGHGRVGQQCLRPDDDPEADAAEAGRQQHRFDLRLPSEDVDDEEPDSGQQRGHEGQACEPLGCRVLRDL